MNHWECVETGKVRIECPPLELPGNVPGNVHFVPLYLVLVSYIYRGRYYV